jgi:hypothetical protein
MGRASTFAALFEVLAADYAMEQCTAPTRGFEVVRAPALARIPPGLPDSPLNA